MPRNQGRSPITRPGYRRGLPSGNKGRKLPTEILTPGEVQALLRSFGAAPSQIRDCAIVQVMYGAGLKIGELVALERPHYQPATQRLLVPPGKQRPKREVQLDARTCESLDAWMAVRKDGHISLSAPLFCTISHDAKGHRIFPSVIREWLTKRAADVGIDRRVNTDALRLSGIAHRARRADSLESSIGTYIDDARFVRRHREAYDRLQSAIDLYSVHPERHATRIGHECREAMQLFANTLAPDSAGGTVDRIRAVLASVEASASVTAQCDALVRYWGTTSDLAQRQEHGATREGEPLSSEDARRLIFHATLVMYEIDRLVFPD
jgi:hypothetical protein